MQLTVADKKGQGITPYLSVVCKRWNVAVQQQQAHPRQRWRTSEAAHPFHTASPRHKCTAFGTNLLHCNTRPTPEEVIRCSSVLKTLLYASLLAHVTHIYLHPADANRGH
jgi:hypothetical protein